MAKASKNRAERMFIGESDCINVLEKRKDVPLAIKTETSRNLAFVVFNA